jgi:hypothetical protein
MHVLLPVTLGPSMTSMCGIAVYFTKLSLMEHFYEMTDFTIASEVFKELWFLVDGIYPPICHFVHPITVSIDVDEALFSLWHESSRKDVYHFFGVLKKKFNVCSKGLNSMNFNNVVVDIYCCMILHNMNVVECIEKKYEGTKDASFYDVVEEEEEEEEEEEDDVSASPANAEALQFLLMEEEDVNRRVLEGGYLQQLGINIHDSTLQHDREHTRIFSQLIRMAAYHWGQLYDLSSNKRLTAAIMKQQDINYKAAKSHNSFNY